MNRVHGRYTAFWLSLLIISTGFVFLYQAVSEGITIVKPTISFLGLSVKIDSAVWEIATYITVVGAILLWWRVVKVLILQGSPLPSIVGLSIDQQIPGKQDAGRAGRPVHSYFIGSDKGEVQLFYGAVFRAHSSSDKLVRARLEHLMLTLPFNVTLLIFESGLSFRVMNHQARNQMFFRVLGKYNPPPSGEGRTLTPEQYRNSVVEHLEYITDEMRNKGKRIDGLEWHQPNLQGEGGLIRDDFGFHLWYDKLEGGRYRVRSGEDRDGGVLLGSVDELRQFVRERLHAVE